MNSYKSRMEEIMGEIKSTLDLVMEKTRHLTLSSEEKAEQQQAEFLGLVEGLVQKYTDGALTVEGVCKELQSLRERHGQSDLRPALKVVLDRLDPDSDPESLLDLAHALAGVDTKGLKSALDGYQAEKAAAEASVRASLEKDLASTRRISGRAVTVNLEASPVWIEELAQLRRRLDDQLEAEKKPLISG